jgi:hypothetical protein
LNFYYEHTALHMNIRYNINAMDSLKDIADFIKRAYTRPVCYLLVYWMTLFDRGILHEMETRGYISHDDKDKYHEWFYYTLNGGGASLTRNILAGATVSVLYGCYTSTSLLWRIKFKNDLKYCTIKRSNRFANMQGGYAFMATRPYVGRDVAGMIARMVARMYIADIQWIKLVERDNKINIKEKRTREQLCRLFAQIEL